jgi:hypothetical protein
MAQRETQPDPKGDTPREDLKRDNSDNPLDSGLRRKFLAFCEENPSADECRIYET